MRIPRVYINEPLTIGSAVILTGNARDHLIQVLRLAPGAQVQLFNGCGGSYQATLGTSNRKQVSLEIIAFEPTTHRSPLSIHLGQAISRGERMDFVMQKSVELGVHEITPLITTRCVLKLDRERAASKQQHWQKIAIHACEQCGRDTVPIIHPPIALAEWLQKVTAELKFVLHHTAAHTLASYQLKQPQLATTSLLIGPEGGLSEAEIALASTHAYQALRLGPRILRTETAALAALTLLQASWGDLS